MISYAQSTNNLEMTNTLSQKAYFFDMDGVLVDFASGLKKQSEQTLALYKGREDEIPGLFGAMEPMEGAIEAVHRLAEHYDCYILSTAPWKNPSSWSDKLLWVQRYLNDIFYKRIILSHNSFILRNIRIWTKIKSFPAYSLD